MVGSYTSITRLQHTFLGRLATDMFLRAFELVGLAPAGTARVSRMLNRGAEGLKLGGQRGVFTPMLLVVGVKKA